MSRPSILALLLLARLATPSHPEDRTAEGPDALKPTLRSDSLVVNGLTRSKDGRLFSPFPRQTKGEGIELGEGRDGKPIAFPGEARGAKPLRNQASGASIGAMTRFITDKR